MVTRADFAMAGQIRGRSVNAGQHLVDWRAARALRLLIMT